MKRFLVCVLSLSLLLCSLPLAASANSWGLKGDLLEAVMADSIWNDYTTVSNQSGDAAVMGSRYHRALMVMVDGKLQVHTTAVYQVDDHLPGRATVSCKGDELTLSYGDAESFCFRLREDGYRLHSAVIGKLTVKATDSDWRYLFSCDGESALLQQQMPLELFNISLFPRSLDEVRHLNLMNAVLDSSDAFFGDWGFTGDPGQLYQKPGKGNVPVYSAPYGASAWRAAKGKAAVSLEDELWLQYFFTNADGEQYACVRYNVSQRTQRIGFIEAASLGETATAAPTEGLIDVHLRATRDTYLTDDPDVSEFEQFLVPAGTQLTCIGRYGANYAYVTAEVKDKRFVSGGQIVQGFVPMRDLEIDMDMNGSVLCPDVLAQLEGCWYFEAGGNQAEDYLVLGADGSYVGHNGLGDGVAEPDTRYAQYYVTSYHGARNLFWNDPPYTLTVIYRDGRVNFKGLEIGEDGNSFSLTFWEGGGGYRRITPSEMEAMMNGARE